MSVTPELAAAVFAAESSRITVTLPPVAIAACSAAAVVRPRLKLTLLSPTKIVESVAITVVPSSSRACPPVASPATIVAAACRLVLVVFNRFEMTVPPAGLNVTEVAEAGARVSITSALPPAIFDEPDGTVVLVSAFPAASVILPGV